MGDITRRLEAINKSVGHAVRWLALAMMLTQFCIVLLRYVFGISTIALNESVLYMHATFFMLAAGYTLLVDGHVRIDIFYARLPEGWQRAINLFGYLVMFIPALVTILYWTWPTVKNAWAIREGPISVGGIPAVFLLKSLMTAFCILLLVQAIAEIIRLVGGGKRETT